jgi:regulator of protease activity HflC (stomatin/prohibitin superfamily)
MEKQVNSERERRAIFARSEGDKQSRINTSEGRKREMINLSEGEMFKQINEAEGRSAEILAISEATAESIEKIGAAATERGGEAAFVLDLAEKYIKNIGHLGTKKTEVILGADLTNLNKLLENLDLNIDRL